MVQVRFLFEAAFHSDKVEKLFFGRNFLEDNKLVRFLE